MKKYLRIGFHLSWIAILFMSIGFVLEFASERLRINVKSGKDARASFSNYNTHREILNREIYIAQHLAHSTNENFFLEEFSKWRIINYGIGTSLYEIDILLAQSPRFFPELNMEDLEQTKKKIVLLGERGQKLMDMSELPTDQVIELARETTEVQHEIIIYSESAFLYNERLIARSQELLSFSSFYSTRIVLVAFFLTLIIFIRLQWLEYKSERRIGG